VRDLVFIAVVAVFFVLGGLFVAACGWIVRGPDEASSERRAA
jgi:hypothetical protein